MGITLRWKSWIFSKWIIFEIPLLEQHICASLFIYIWLFSNHCSSHLMIILVNFVDSRKHFLILEGHLFRKCKSWLSRFRKTAMLRGSFSSRFRLIILCWQINWFFILKSINGCILKTNSSHSFILQICLFGHFTGRKLALFPLFLFIFFLGYLFLNLCFQLSNLLHKTRQLLACLILQIQHFAFELFDLLRFTFTFIF